MILLALGLILILAAVVPGFVDAIWPVVAVALPFIQARLVSDQAAKWLKFVVSILFAIAAGAFTALGMDWSAGFQIEQFAERAAAIFGVAYATYKTIKIRQDAVGGAGLNEQTWAAPDRGLGA